MKTDAYYTYQVPRWSRNKNHRARRRGAVLESRVSATRLRIPWYVLSYTACTLLVWGPSALLRTLLLFGISCEHCTSVIHVMAMCDQSGRSFWPYADLHPPVPYCALRPPNLVTDENGKGPRKKYSIE